MMDGDPRTISDARIQLHWSVQLVSAAADAILEPTDDDSHSNFGWDPADNRLSGRVGCGIDVPRFALIAKGDSLSLAAQTLDSARTWLGQRLSTEIRFRDYDMPAHPVLQGAPFSPNLDHLKWIAQWFTFAQDALMNYGSLRVWPHHFDMGFWNPGDQPDKSIGGGFTLGDQYYEQPYFYINPNGVDPPPRLPDLAHGFWSEHWFGAVLTSDQLMDKSRRVATAEEFLASAIRHCKDLLGG